MIAAPASLLAGRYALGETIAVGGGATVQRGVDTRLGRGVAVKRPRSVEAHARLCSEARVLARCAHPGVVACLDAGEDAAGEPYLVLALVDGANLVQHVARQAPPRPVARVWSREVVRAVSHLHARGIVHGDLKAQHIVIGRDGHAVVVDLDHAGEATSVEVARDRAALARIVRWLLAQSQTGRA